jgi:hypothetical protein
VISPRISLVVFLLIVWFGSSVKVLAADAPAAEQKPLPVECQPARNGDPIHTAGR